MAGLSPGMMLLSLILILLSALFSGLTLGVLGLDVSSLEILLESGDPKESKYAKIILPIRKRGNLLLCTLLLGNVMVNSALSITMSSVTSGAVGFAVSTALIVLFGEILPQSVCSRHGLMIGAYTSPIVYVVMAILFPLAWPVSRALDFLLGEELPTIYNKRGLKKLIELHRHHEQEAQLKQAEANIMTGALTFGDLKAINVMTPIEKCYTLDVTQKLDFDTMKTIFMAGYSRVPVFDKSIVHGDKCVGVLLVKDLILVDPEDAIPVGTVINIFAREVVNVFPDLSLSEVLQLFKSGKSHIAMVRDVEDKVDGDPYYVTKGIVTLEDIIEAIIRDNINDEMDLAGAKDRFDYSRLNVFNDLLMGKFSETRLSAEEANAVFYHLFGTCKHFSLLSKTALASLIEESQVVFVEREDPMKKLRKGNVVPLIQAKDEESLKREQLDVLAGGWSLYKKGSPSEYCTLVLSGKLEVRAGKEGFSSTVGRFAILGVDALNVNEDEKKTPLLYQPDFSAIIQSTARVLRISRARYFKALEECGITNASAAALMKAGPEHRSSAKRFSGMYWKKEVVIKDGDRSDIVTVMKPRPTPFEDAHEEGKMPSLDPSRETSPAPIALKEGSEFEEKESERMKSTEEVEMTEKGGFTVVNMGGAKKGKYGELIDEE